MSQTIALIPARGGSKGVKRKNLRDVAGRPLLQHAVDAARQSKHIREIYLSSEDEDILAAGGRIGCKLVRRPDALARDESTANDVVLDFFAQIPLSDDDLIVYLQPTSPLRTAAHIDAALQAMEFAKADGAVSVMELEKSPYKSFRLDEQGRLESLFGEKYSNHNRQQLPKTYMPNGAIYIFRKKFFLDRGGFPSDGSIPYIMSKRDSIDIDEEGDLELATRIMEQRNGGV